ncbi:hypothetical protein GcM1_172004 [Golovinomyces cichoracearum]|uniref:Uncharacterized protein n=1 Tax=Golovinomyces cichoracearum TaxID=62708 RepID=A0A420J6C3_9PEZI|nr:hypothetical protein GcM1_172004 [Golovinomyces cichoracearum]
MIPEDTTRPKNSSREKYDVISNKIGVLLSQRESLVRSWYSVPPARKQEEFDADDAVLLCNQPGHSGIGASIPSNFFISEAERSKKTLRSKLLESKNLVARKTKDTDDKVTPLKKISRDDSSDEELGRSSLGRSKKQKLSRSAEQSMQDKMLSDDHFRQTSEYLNPNSLNNKSKLISDKRTDTCCIKDKSPAEEVKTGQADNFQGEKNLDEVNVLNRQKITHDRTKAVGIPKSSLGEIYTIKHEEKKRMKKREKKKKRKLKAENLNINS